MRVWFFILSLITLPCRSVESYIPTFDTWLDASRTVGISPSMLYSMSLAESGKQLNGDFLPHPFAIALGKDKSVGQLKHEGFYPESYEEAKAMLQNLLKAGYTNIGVGIMQINLKANSHMVENPLDLLDPTYNISIATQVIRQCSNDRTTTEMLSCYSSGYYESENGYRYADRVYQYDSMYGQQFAQINQPVGVLSLNELLHFYKNRQPHASQQGTDNTIETLTGTTTYDF